MKATVPADIPREIELKLALSVSDPSALAARLARSPLLARRKPSRQHLHNIYYDTPGQDLRSSRAALRLRRVGSPGRPRWLQTLKLSDAGDSALTQRGEWETAVPGAALSIDALQATPWSRIDDDGTLFGSLVPCFATSFDRTSWLVRRRDGSVVDVALDIGEIVAGGRTEAICELELELRVGEPAVLFEVALQLCAAATMLPWGFSKAQRGYALLEGLQGMPVRARPVELTPELSLARAASQVLHEMFQQFTANLVALRTSDDPEVVHQARVGWRRFRSSTRLFRPALAGNAPPSWQALAPLMEALGELRDLDVASTQTLPGLARDYADGDERRADAWDGLASVVALAAGAQRQAVRAVLEQPDVGAALIAAAQWLEALPGSGGVAEEESEPSGAATLRHWARHRLRRMRARLQAASRRANDAAGRHRVRILAKRLRYGVEALRTLLPERRARRWQEQAAGMQATIGTARDVIQAAAIASRLGSDADIAAFLRGVAVGLERGP